MAKKTLIQFTDLNETLTPISDQVTGTTNTRKKFDTTEVRSSHGYVSELSRSLQEIDEVKLKASEYETKQSEGHVINELNHELIDFSFVKDRISVQDTKIDDLADDIQEHGQQSPILVRPHPNKAGRFQIVYGHRRYLATKKLGIAVQALIKNIDDEQLIIVQGQENSSRENLSFIEKALFGLEIRKRGFAHDVIMSALNLSSSMAYRYLKIAEQITPEIIYKIGAAPTIGRRPWTDLSEMIQDRVQVASDFLENPSLNSFDSNEKFHALLTHLNELATTKKEPQQTSSTEIAFVSTDTNSIEEAKGITEEVWKSPRNELVAKFRTGSKGTAVQFEKPKAKEFGGWLRSQIERLYEEFEQSTKTETTNGD